MWHESSAWTKTCSLRWRRLTGGGAQVGGLHTHKYECAKGETTNAWNKEPSLLELLQSSSRWLPAWVLSVLRMPPSPVTPAPPTSQRHGRGSTLCGLMAACRVTCKHCPGSGTARPRNITTPSCTRGVGRRWVGGGQPSLPPLLLKMQLCGRSGVSAAFHDGSAWLLLAGGPLL